MWYLSMIHQTMYYVKIFEKASSDLSITCYVYYANSKYLNVLSILND